jgi:FKBP-type peptidyl-prolyl cis-trans isomerase
MSLKNDDAPPSPLIDPILLKDLTEEQRQEALAAAAAAKRAEERAEQRALARALERKRLERLEEEERDKERKRKFLQQLKFEKDHAVLPHNFQGRNNGRGNGEEIRNEGSLMTEGGQTQVVFLSKKQREQIKNGNDSTMSLVDSV